MKRMSLWNISENLVKLFFTVKAFSNTIVTVITVHSNPNLDTSSNLANIQTYIIVQYNTHYKKFVLLYNN
jgi:hypothetical protein